MEPRETLPPLSGGRRRRGSASASTLIAVLALVAVLLLSTPTSAQRPAGPDCRCAEAANEAVGFCLPRGGVLLQRFADQHCDLGADAARDKCADGEVRVCIKQQAAAAQ